MPLIEVLQNFLDMHGNKSNTQKFIHTDQGGELWGSFQFQQLARDKGYIVQPTALDASFQNTIAESPNCTLAERMRSLLYSAHLGPEYSYMQYT